MDEGRLTAGLVNGRGDRETAFGIDIGDDDTGRFFTSEQTAGSGADPGGATGNDGNFALESHRVCSPSGGTRNHDANAGLTRR